MMNNENQIDEFNEVNNSPTEKRGRGRPKKIIIIDETIIKRGRGRPKITDESLKKVRVKSHVRGRPKLFLNLDLDDDFTLFQQRYKDRYYYIHQLYYTLKQHQDNIPDELKNLPQDTDEQVKTKACMLKQHVAHLEFEKHLLNINNISYKPRKNKSI